MEERQRLFSDFPPVSTAEWEAKIREDLKGADYEKKLVWKTLEEFRVKPYYTAEDLQDLKYLDQPPGSFPFVRGNKVTGNDWDIRQDIRVSDVAAAAQKAILAVDRGITSIGFDLVNKGDLYYHDFKQLISGLDLTRVKLNLIAGEAAPDMLDFLLQAMEELKIPATTLKGSLCFDPLGQLTCTGGFYRSEQADMETAEQLLLSAENELPGFRVLPVNSYLFSNAGASAVQELAFALAMSAEYLTRLTDMGHGAAEIAGHMQWNMGVGSNYFMEIAKIRAARLLFSNMVGAYEGGSGISAPVFIHSITTDWNKTLYDPNVNMLRLTTEAMAAVLGGCDSLLVKPYDTWYKEPGDFSERVSRNIQVILKGESYFNKVADPAAGSYFIESLTHSLAEHAWQLFLKTDERGGYVKAFKQGFVQEETAKTASLRRQMIASRREILLGTNQYPNASERITEQVDPERAFSTFERSANPVAEPIVTGRGAVGFEKLRLAAEKHSGGRPRVFMLTYGNLAMRLARSQFAGNFFACAGYEVTDNLGFATAGEGVKAAMDAKADIIVLCSSDEEYAALAPPVYEQVKGRAIVVVAGATACMDELKQKGIQEFIHVRSNVLETLGNFHNKLGIKS